MNSQDRMKAGGEHLLDRLKAALQDEKGVQLESLLTCLGALAGYACQVSVRHTAPLMTVATADGTKYLYGDALNAPLAESPLSQRHRLRRTLSATSHLSSECSAPTAAS